MSIPDLDRLFVCYVPSLDSRRVRRDLTPFVADLLESYQSIGIKTQPTTDLVPTLVTGTTPGVHEMWQVSLRDEPECSPLDPLLNRLPDRLSVLIQCTRHFFDPEFDLPAIPRRRRRHFNLHRLKYTLRYISGASVNTIGGVPSLFGLLGAEASYSLGKHLADLPDLARTKPDGRYRLEFFEFYAFDIFSHWHLDQTEKIEAELRRLDSIFQKIYRNCREENVTFMLLVDHGQEQVQEHLNLHKVLDEAGVLDDDLHYFIEVAVTRFWFRTERSRRRVTSVLENTSQVSIMQYQELSKFGIHFEDNRFGELYAIADHGVIFFPHDFYEPLANTYLGLTQPEMRPRLKDPRVRGYHGHHPDHPSEQGFMVLADERFTPAGEWMALQDFAPTIMQLLGMKPPKHMEGRPMLIANRSGSHSDAE